MLVLLVVGEVGSPQRGGILVTMLLDAPVLASVKTSKRPCVQGGDYDRWDLEAGRGILGGARTRLVAEEHGRGRQLVRVRAWPHCSAKGLVITLVYAILSLLAAHASAWGVAAALGAVVLVLALRAGQACGAASAAVLQALETDRAVGDSKAERLS